MSCKYLKISYMPKMGKFHILAEFSIQAVSDCEKFKERYNQAKQELQYGQSSTAKLEVSIEGYIFATRIVYSYTCKEKGKNRICVIKLKLLLVPCVQEVVTSIYIVTHYINWGNYFLDTQYYNIEPQRICSG